MKRGVHLLCFIIYFFSILGNCQVKTTAGGYPISHFGVKTYNMHPRNFAILQDQRELIYFGNPYGIIEFDGNSWRNILLPNGNSGYSLGLGNDKKVYVGSFNELGYLTSDTSGLTFFKSLYSIIPTKDNQFGTVLSVFSKENQVVYHTFSGLFLYSNDHFQIIRPSSITNSFPFATKLGEKLYVQEAGKGLMWLNGNHLELVEGGEIFKSKTIKNILPLESNHLLVVEEDGLFEFDFSSRKPFHSASSDIIKTRKITDAIYFHNGSLLVSTYNSGFYIMDRNGKIENHVSIENGLHNNTINDVFIDRRGGLWLAMDNGIAYLDVNTPISFIGRSYGVEGMGYTAALFDNKIYLGTSQGLFYAEWKANKVDRLFKPVTGVRGQVWNVSVVENTLVCNQVDHTYQINGTKGDIISGNYDDEGNWKMISLKNKPNYAIKGTYLGFQLYKLVNKQWKFIGKIKGFEESARVFIQDDNETIWVCHGNKGIYKLELSEDLLSVATSINFTVKNGFKADFFNDVSVINNQMVFSSDAGPYVLDPVKDKLVKFEALENTIGKNVFINRITQYPDGNIWLFSGNDLYLFRRSKNGGFVAEHNIFKKISGELIGSYEFVLPVYSQTAIIGIQEGFAFFDLEGKNKMQKPFHVAIRKVESSASKDSLLFGGVAVLKSNEKSPIQLSYNLNSIRITYSALWYENAEQLKYQYALSKSNAKDIQWSGWTKNTQVDFSNLGEGTYIFHVRAKNIYDELSEKSSFAIVILPPWYRSAWAYVVYFLLVGATIVLLFLYVKRLFKRQKDRLKEQGLKELRMLEQKHIAEKLLAEKELIELRNVKLEAKVVLKNNELASLAASLTQKTEFLVNLKDKLETINKESELPDNTSFKEVIKTIDQDLDFDDNWAKFQLHFDELHNNFLHRLRIKYPKLNPSWLILCAYIRMNKSNKEIAALMNISVAGVEKRKYRLREKLELENEGKLSNFISEF